MDGDGWGDDVFENQLGPHRSCTEFSVFWTQHMRLDPIGFIWWFGLHEPFFGTGNHRHTLDYSRVLRWLIVTVAARPLHGSGGHGPTRAVAALGNLGQHQLGPTPASPSPRECGFRKMVSWFRGASSMTTQVHWIAGRVTQLQATLNPPIACSGSVAIEPRCWNIWTSLVSPSWMPAFARMIFGGPVSAGTMTTWWMHIKRVHSVADHHGAAVELLLKCGIHPPSHLYRWKRCGMSPCMSPWSHRFIFQWVMKLKMKTVLKWSVGELEWQKVTACWHNVILFKAVLSEPLQFWKILLCSSPARGLNLDSDLDDVPTWSNYIQL